MEVNWPERFYCRSFVRKIAQWREVGYFRATHPIPAGARVLEIGCGDGGGAGIFARLFQPGLYHGLDVDPAMIKVAARRPKKGPLAKSLFLLGDAERLPYADGAFDAVVNFGIVHHLPDWRKGVAELARVLRVGGAFYFEEIYPPLYANPLFRVMLAHPREDRFHGPEFRAALAGEGLTLLPDFHESRLFILGVAIKTARP
ncbi:class I SAM-dependent methyltransferase [Solidesulfovibrio sp.]|uniref:class I SAM-dependent methyltransferase n=1 Tax=Solidesulfovibrio sp. TaxID=2910990 RepID=UPI002B210B5C|nr:class I SAM-dependent methyltransferase [Solidesulfovibrio sp.]MEA4856782.1 class I SAM-dependent methyltransferase [Solidesulfovibrio sp.]